MTLRSPHNHPLEGPCIIIHSSGVITHENVTEMPMHAFGPFASELAARVWHEASPPDECVKTIIDFFEPALPEGFFRCPLCYEPEAEADRVAGVCLSCADAIAFSQHARRASITPLPSQHERTQR